MTVYAIAQLLIANPVLTLAVDSSTKYLFRATRIWTIPS